MIDRDAELALDDAQLLARCEVHLYRASGPGGQHRNKVTSAVRLHHRDTGLSATATESRSQHENRRSALRRLRQKLTCEVRRPIDPAVLRVPGVVRECLSQPKGSAPGAPQRVDIGRKDPKFWTVAAFLLDLLECTEGRAGVTSALLKVTTGSLVRVLRHDRHVLAAAQQIRRRHSLPPLS